METDQVAEDALAGSRKTPVEINYEETNDIMDRLSERLQEEVAESLSQIEED